MTHPNVRSFQSVKCTMSLKDLSLTALRSALWHEFGDAVPDEGTFNVEEYFEGKQHAKKSGPICYVHIF